LLTLLMGCQQGVYRASSLPPELVAPPVVGRDSFDLTQLGAALVNKEIIHPGDQLHVTVNSGDDEQKPPTWELSVGEDGSIAVPLLGPVHVAGLGLAAASHAIRDASMRRQIYTDPIIDVTFKERAVNRVTVVGAVNAPGAYDLPPGCSTLGVALASAHGLGENASPIVDIQNPTRYARLDFRPGVDAGATRQVGYQTGPQDGRPLPNASFVRVSLLETSAGPGLATPADRLFLHDGAVVTVAEKPERFITVMGLTGNQVLPLPPNREVRLLDALASVGGPRHSIWIADKVKIVRQVPGSNQTATITASIRRAKKDRAENIRLAPGDIISVEENVVTFTIDTLGSIFGVGLTAANAARTGSGL